jgi:hypothetical protein
VEPPILGLRGGDEVEVATGQLGECRRLLRFPDHHDEGATDVVEAVTMVPAGRRMVRVLEEPDVVGQPEQVLE